MKKLGVLGVILLAVNPEIWSQVSTWTLVTNVSGMKSNVVWTGQTYGQVTDGFITFSIPPDASAQLGVTGAVTQVTLPWHGTNRQANYLKWTMTVPFPTAGAPTGIANVRFVPSTNGISNSVSSVRFVPSTNAARRTATVTRTLPPPLVSINTNLPPPLPVQLNERGEEILPGEIKLPLPPIYQPRPAE